MPERFSRRILDHLSDSRYRPLSIRELAETLNISDADFEEFQRAAEQLISAGQAIFSSADAIALPPIGREMIGTFRRTSRGFGFVCPDPDKRTAHGDLFVPAHVTAGAMTGDRVRAKVRQDDRRAGDGRSPYTGQIVEIIQRAQQHFVGTLFQNDRKWFVQTDGNALTDPVVVRDASASNAREGDKVVIELLQYPTDDFLAEGVITEVLGEAGLPEVETQAVIRAFGLPGRFTPEVLEEARAASNSFDPQAVPAERLDLTGQLICTIDPPDAKDFDDAISLRKLDPRAENDDAAWELGVHIADVSHFVKAGGALDVEAARRANSTYLPRKVIPMLPELLSNGVCSLQEGVNRFTKSAFIRYDAAGKVVGEKYANTVIRSAKRLTYIEAQALIDRDLKLARKHTKTDPKYSQELLALLSDMNELAQVVRKRRLDAGMIELGLPEVDLVYDEAGHVVDAQPEDDAFTHKLIEMFMVEANEAVARLFDRLDVPMIRRIHPDPSYFDMDGLRQFARVAGHNIPARPTRKELQQLLDAVRGKPAQQAVHLAVLRTLAKAEYAPLLLGHFALASEHYTHFTSPIRRYPDLIVHRALDVVLEQGLGNRPAKKSDRHALREHPRLLDETRLQEISRHCSTTERNSEAAERDLRQFLVLQLLEDHLGDDFEGTVTGVTPTGLFVQIDRYLVDGFIRMSDLSAGGLGQRGERWRFNRQDGALVAERSGRRIAIGARFLVRIAKVSAEARLLELVILQSLGGGTGGTGASGNANDAQRQRQQRKAAKENKAQAQRAAKKARSQSRERGRKSKKRRG